MYKYHCLNPISEVGLGQLDENYVVTGDVEEADAILVRSAKMHDIYTSYRFSSSNFFIKSTSATTPS